MQNFMYRVLAGDNEAAAKKSLAVCTELWRRRVWHDDRTVNVIGECQNNDCFSEHTYMELDVT